MMDFIMTVLAYGQCFPLLGYHYNFPLLFSFEVLHFIYMVYLKRSVRFSAQFADLCGQPFFEGGPGSCVSDCILNNYVTEAIAILTVHIFSESPVFSLSFRGIIRNTPAAAASAEFISDFFAGAFMLACKGFQATVLHKIREIIQTREVTRNTIVIADTSEFGVVRIYDF